MSEKNSLAPHDQMMQWITGKWIGQPIYVAARLGIADLLRDGPRSVDELAGEAGCRASMLARLLRALVSVGIFEEIADGRLSLNSLGGCLLPEAMGPLALFFLSPWHNQAWSGLEHSIRNGKPGFDQALGQPSFEWLEKNPDARDDLDRAQAVKTLGFARAVSANYVFSGIERICDLGGGNGTFLLHILAANPNLEGIIADLEGAAGAARKKIIEAGLEDRCRFWALDFFNQPPPKADAYLLVNILHDWDDQECGRILDNLARVLPKNGKALIVEYLLEPGPGFNIAKLLDLEMLVMSGGRERSKKEYRELLRKSDLIIRQTTQLPGGLALMEAVHI